eukprot:CAMPEP_0168474846 /NCGR_PEP_ID=MMETSP0228-20121227/61058_1 /TAXON_ID=133427 /ORGANISM="Protoceratium reticulatum, Strain CCCM 535 (=CCMP 1889)" /LENGTH=102 /DNA_ID=CAMNT_0008490899 /DNA_START=29 /DNA_END=333 /DNA_ORIENTATION=+
MTLEDLRQLVATVDCNVLRVNSLDLKHATEEDSADCALYEHASRFNHSCAPNLSRRFGAGERVQLRTSRAVAAGEELTISYLGDEELLQCTARRRWHLRPWG